MLLAYWLIAGLVTGLVLVLLGLKLRQRLAHTADFPIESETGMQELGESLSSTVLEGEESMRLRDAFPAAVNWWRRQG